MKRRTKLKINYFKTLSVILILVFILSLPFVIQGLININNIECISQFGNCDEVIGNRLQVIGNLTNSKKQIKQILDQDIQINSYLIQYKIPDTLKVEVNIKKPKYTILGLENKYYLIDKNGLILETSNTSNLPTLVIPNFVGELGKNIPDSYIFALKIIEKVAWLYSVKTGNLENSELKIILKEGVLVHFPLEGDIDTLVGSLRLIFSRLNDSQEGIKMSDTKEIDLRYKNAVLR